jgi:tetratricopeptide (TPR) repeat protein
MRNSTKLQREVSKYISPTTLHEGGCGTIIGTIVLLALAIVLVVLVIQYWQYVLIFLGVFLGIIALVAIGWGIKVWKEKRDLIDYQKYLKEAAKKREEAAKKREEAAKNGDDEYAIDFAQEAYEADDLDKVAYWCDMILERTPEHIEANSLKKTLLKIEAAKNGNDEIAMKLAAECSEKDAIEWYEIILKRNPTHEDAKNKLVPFYLSISEKHLEDKKIDDAEFWCRKALLVDSDSQRAKLLLQIIGGEKIAKALDDTMRLINDTRKEKL